MLDDYGRTVIKILITGEDETTEPTLCVRYTDEKVDREICHHYAGNNCKRCPIHLAKAKVGMANNTVSILREYRYDIDTPDKNKVSGLTVFIKSIFHKRS